MPRCAVLCRLSPQALADLCVARQLYSSTLMRIKHQRQLLVLQLAQLISNAHSRPTEQTYRTDSVFYGVSGGAFLSVWLPEPCCVCKQALTSLLPLLCSETLNALFRVGPLASATPGSHPPGAVQADKETSTHVLTADCRLAIFVCVRRSTL